MAGARRSCGPARPGERRLLLRASGAPNLVRIFGAIFLPQSEDGDIFGDGVNIAARIERLASVGAGDACFERLSAVLRR